MATLLGLLLLLPLPAAAFEARLSTTAVPAGGVLAVSVQGAGADEASCQAPPGACPLYPAGPGRRRGLIAVPAETPPGLYAVELSRPRRLRGDERRSLPYSVLPSSFTHQDLTLSAEKAALARSAGAEAATARLEELLALESPERLYEGIFQLPVEGGRLTSQYGHPRTVNRSQPWPRHKGVDLAAREGTPVLAPNHALVALATSTPVQGGVVVLDHGQGVLSALLHLKTLDVRVGRVVQRGTRVGTVGTTGFSTGPHLHWELRVHGAAVDPLPWLTSGY
ncbi:MAG TPA: hypothetical protein DCM05_12530 [Elusimicrobia bacterium]|nr:hypothetical protein [Elusimicrobiota bacterium]